MAKIDFASLAETLSKVFKDRTPEVIVRVCETCDCPACTWWRTRDSADPEAS
jgi:hypothetical protein